MDAGKTGVLIRQLRTDKGMTQKQLAGALHVSDKAVSKWERGMGCPDVSMLSALAAALDVDVTSLLSGGLSKRKINGGNMKRIRFYVCPVCGNVLTATADAEVSCCSRPLEALKPVAMDEMHRPVIEPMDGEWFVKFDHPMSKEHYICFVACVRFDRVMLVRLYPEQGAELYLPVMPRCRLYVCCSSDGLFECTL